MPGSRGSVLMWGSTWRKVREPPRHWVTRMGEALGAALEVPLGAGEVGDGGVGWEGLDAGG
ncbi:hypothetical protein, partial [Streptomyces nigra]